MKMEKSKKKIGINDLAVMVQRGFLETREYMDKRFEKLEKGQAALEKGQAALEKGQDEIKMQLDRRVHIFDHKDLEFRVEKLEEKAGLTRRK